MVFRADDYCSLGIVRSLGRLGIRVFCIDHDPDALVPKSRYCAGRYTWDFESSDPDDSAQFLVDLARRLGERPLLLPTFDTRNLFVDRYRSELSRWYILPQPPPGAMARLYSKKGMYELCKALGVPTPESAFPASVEQAVRAGAGMRLPIVVKAIDGDRLMHRTGRRMATVHAHSDLRATYAELDEPGVSNLVLQEFIPGTAQDDWILSAYFDARSACRFVITGRKLRQLPVGGGVTTLGECVPCEAMIESIRQVAGAAGYRGILDADYRYDARDGRWKLLDVNPRPGANFRLFVDAHGLDVVRTLYLDLTGQPVPPVEPRWGRRWLVEDKDLSALSDHIRAGSLTIGDWLRSLRAVSELAHWAFDDPRPSMSFAAALLANRLRSLARRVRRGGGRSAPAGS